MSNIYDENYIESKVYYSTFCTRFCFSATSKLVEIIQSKMFFELMKRD